jgi:hypothetical protein
MGPHTKRWIGAVAIATVLSLGVQSCGDDPEPAAIGKSAVADQPSRSEAKRVAALCEWSRGRRVGSDRVRAAFVEGGAGEVRLLLESTAVRPGAVFQVAVANDSHDSVRYGTFSHIEHAGSSEPVEIKGPYGFRSIALYAVPGGVGPCVGLPVPSTTPPGRYRAVLDDVRGNAVNGGHELEAEIAVRGAPIPHPRWEAQLRRAARENRENG